MNIKNKLNNFIKINHDSDTNFNNLDDIVIDLLKEIECKNLDYIHYHSSKIKLYYDDFINIWYNFINKNILELKNKTIMDIAIEHNKSSLKISLFDNKLSIILEELFNMHIQCIDDDLLLIYIRDEDQVLLMYKSYIPLMQSNTVRLPFWEYIIKNHNIKKEFEHKFNNDDNLCIVGFSI